MYTAIKNILTFTVRGSTFDCRCQIHRYRKELTKAVVLILNWKKALKVKAQSHLLRELFTGELIQIDNFSGE